MLLEGEETTSFVATVKAKIQKWKRKRRRKKSVAIKDEI